ncbi:SRPBCC family protein [Jiangella asiatica]|uniref:SRPBCC family protein n=1 Tax=Jiangella asiatica TaxID=2530372 RepID=A0A4R5CNB1_9ACTN|nr:SRPBCC family protein [Jiangella asiatica]TDD99042.1 SRPBCC family protein [Jiangella asiatica]
MATRTETRDRDSAGTGGGPRSLMDELPLDRLKDEARHGLASVGEWAMKSASDKLTRATERLDDIANGEPAGEAVKGAATGGVPGAAKGVMNGIKDKIAGVFSRGGDGGGGDKATKATNIIEEIDIGAPIGVVYNQWTQFQDFSNFMKKVESVEQVSDEKLDFKAQLLWSHRTWEATILDQVADQHIVWRSAGPKGHVDGAVTFHELAPRLTRVVVVLEYYPQGLLERTGNIWRAQGRRARLELKHFRRHVMMHLLVDPDQVEGWRGEIHDREVSKTHDEALEEERAVEESEQAEEPEEDVEDEELEDEDEYDDEYDEEPAEEPAEEAYADEDAEEPEEDVDEEPVPRRRRRSR